MQVVNEVVQFESTNNAINVTKILNWIHCKIDRGTSTHEHSKAAIKIRHITDDTDEENI